MLLVKKITNTIKLFIIVIFITFSLSLLIDFFLGKLILKSLDPYLSKTNFISLKSAFFYIYLVILLYLINLKNSE